MPESDRLAPGPYRKVGNIFIVHVTQHPFIYGWEINRALRQLRLEYRGEVRVIPDTPAMREWLFRVRHVVNIDMLSLDEAKDMLGIPRGVNFSDLRKSLPRNFGPGVIQDFDTDQAFVDFMEARRMKLRDVMQRDAVELRLLKKRKEALLSAGSVVQNS